jgi:replicative DNA helicase
MDKRLLRDFAQLTPEQQRTVAAKILTGHYGQSESTTDEFQITSMLDYTESAREYARNFGRMQGISTGYPSLDDLTKGLVPGELIVVAGKTSYGKTTLAVNIANRVALAGHRVLFVTLEMTHAQLTSRFIFINGGETEDYLTVATNTLFQRKAELNWKSIDGLISVARKEYEVELVVIDHLHYFTRELENVAEDLGRITKELHKNAMTHGIPVILISHVRKTAKNEGATMDDLRSSSYIAQDADVVLMVGRSEKDPTQMKVRVEKNRNRGFDHTDAERDLIFDRTKILEQSDRKQEAWHPWND